jgi:hypothetical protein
MGLTEAMQVQSTGISGNAPPKTNGVFVTQESLTFPGSAVLVSFLLTLAEVPFRGAATSFWWALGVSSVVGAVIFGFSLTKEMGKSDIVKGAAVAIFNVLVLTGTALGVGSFTAGTAVTA